MWKVQLWVNHAGMQIKETNDTKLHIGIDHNYECSMYTCKPYDRAIQDVLHFMSGEMGSNYPVNLHGIGRLKDRCMYLVGMFDTFMQYYCYTVVLFVTTLYNYYSGLKMVLIHSLVCE